eukprot:NODE_230_length_3340_cov_2.787115.p1 GENE.NODE_230_length_3340_cov_2.787115~~NODE_230_length_3340_cov_2.787115.p1  ORF type:complete len:599 (-),score=218.84 NODE_230_length_3340_cov_2.787115:260-2056(-)
MWASSHEQEQEHIAEVEKIMKSRLQKLHPVTYLDAIGDNVSDIGGTSSDLFDTMCISLSTAVILGSKAHPVPHFGTSLPFIVISTGTIGCTLACFYIWCHEAHSSTRIRTHLRLNLLFVVALVMTVVSIVCYNEATHNRTISIEQAQSYILIVAMGLLAPEGNATFCEFFTSPNCLPVRWIVRNADLGMAQVVLQGLGQGFVSAGAPSAVNIVVQMFAYRWEGFYGLVLLACASQSCTGLQATLASYGAVSNNACRMVHLTTVSQLAYHRSHVCAKIGTTTAHTGKVVAAQNAFFAVTALTGALAADKYTDFGMDYNNTAVAEMSEYTRAGLLAGVIFAMIFLGNELTSCITMAKSVVTLCDGNPEVMPRLDKRFPATHISPLKIIVAYACIEASKLTISPLLNTMAAPLVIGQLLGFRGLLMLVTGSNQVCFTLNMFFVNSGEAWGAARKYLIFGMFKGKDGAVVDTDHEIYETLAIGEEIGATLEDLTAPSLTNFVKFAAVASFTTSNMYDYTPENTYKMGMVQMVINGAGISFFKFGLSRTLESIAAAIRRRQEKSDVEEGKVLLQEMAANEKKMQQQLAQEQAVKNLDDVLGLM